MRNRTGRRMRSKERKEKGYKRGGTRVDGTIGVRLGALAMVLVTVPQALIDHPFVLVGINTLSMTLNRTNRYYHNKKMNAYR